MLRKPKSKEHVKATSKSHQNDQNCPWMKNILARLSSLEVQIEEEKDQREIDCR